MSIFTFISDHDGSEHCSGSIILQNNEADTDILDDLQDLGPVLDYIKSQFPQGWRIKDGEVVAD